MEVNILDVTGDQDSWQPINPEDIHIEVDPDNSSAEDENSVQGDVESEMNSVIPEDSVENSNSNMPESAEREKDAVTPSEISAANSEEPSLLEETSTADEVGDEQVATETQETDASINEAESEPVEQSEEAVESVVERGETAENSDTVGEAEDAEVTPLVTHDTEEQGFAEEIKSSENADDSIEILEGSVENVDNSMENVDDSVENVDDSMENVNNAMEADDDEEADVEAIDVDGVDGEDEYLDVADDDDEEGHDDDDDVLDDQDYLQLTKEEADMAYYFAISSHNRKKIHREMGKRYRIQKKLGDPMSKEEETKLKCQLVGQYLKRESIGAERVKELMETVDREELRRVKKDGRKKRKSKKHGKHSKEKKEKRRKNRELPAQYMDAEPGEFSEPDETSPYHKKDKRHKKERKHKSHRYEEEGYGQRYDRGSSSQGSWEREDWDEGDSGRGWNSPRDFRGMQGGDWRQDARGFERQKDWVPGPEPWSRNDNGHWSPRGQDRRPVGRGNMPQRNNPDWGIAGQMSKMGSYQGNQGNWGNNRKSGFSRENW